MPPLLPKSSWLSPRMIRPPWLNLLTKLRKSSSFYWSITSGIRQTRRTLMPFESRTMSLRLWILSNELPKKAITQRCGLSNSISPCTISCRISYSLRSWIAPLKTRPNSTYRGYCMYSSRESLKLRKSTRFSVWLHPFSSKRMLNVSSPRFVNEK